MKIVLKVTSVAVKQEGEYNGQPTVSFEQPIEIRLGDHFIGKKINTVYSERETLEVGEYELSPDALTTDVDKHLFGTTRKLKAYLTPLRNPNLPPVKGG